MTGDRAKPNIRSGAVRKSTPQLKLKFDFRSDAPYIQIMRTTNQVEQTAVLSIINHLGAASHNRIESIAPMSPAEVSWALCSLENQGLIVYCEGPQLYIGVE